MNAVIFDFDGTLVDSYSLIVGFIASQAGRQPSSLTNEELQSLRSPSSLQIAQKLQVPKWKLPLTYLFGRRYVSRRLHQLQPITGIVSLLQDLQREGCQLYIVSNNGKRNIDNFLIEHGMGGFFRQIYATSGILGKDRRLRQLMRRNNLEPRNVIYVGDEAYDIAAARQAGTAAIAVTWGFSSEEQLLAQQPTLLARTVDQLQKALLDWMQPL